MRILVTGGSGFIGSALIRRIIQDGKHEVLNLDKLTYAATPEALSSVATSGRYEFLKADITDAAAIRRVFDRFLPDAVVNLAAESHVDRSIDGPESFIETNVVGTFRLLEEATRHWERLQSSAKTRFRFLHVSTDEVFGALRPSDKRFTESTAYSPRSPYSASKAASDHLVRAWQDTYGTPTLITNCSNNYGPFQFPEKLIPLVTLRALASEPIPVYGAGENIRDWIHVDDHADAVLSVLDHGEPGETYLVGADSERTNLQVVEAICDLVDQRSGIGAAGPRRNLIGFVTDRPGHDFRYAIDASKIRADIGWSPSVTFDDGLATTIDWYIDNRWWWEPMLANGSDARLGLATTRGQTA